MVKEKIGRWYKVGVGPGWKLEGYNYYIIALTDIAADDKFAYVSIPLNTKEPQQVGRNYHGWWFEDKKMLMPSSFRLKISEFITHRAVSLIFNKL